MRSDQPTVQWHIEKQIHLQMSPVEGCSGLKLTTLKINFSIWYIIFFEIFSKMKLVKSASSLVLNYWTFTASLDDMKHKFDLLLSQKYEFHHSHWSEHLILSLNELL